MMSKLVADMAMQPLVHSMLWGFPPISKGPPLTLCCQVVTAIPAQYFSRRRGLATGLMFAGGGFGGAANSFMLDALITALGTAWAYRILGIATLATGLPAAWLFKERTNNTVARRGFVEW